MESVPLGMDDLFDEHLQEEEDVEQLPQMLPDLPEAEEEDNDGRGTNNDETENKKVLDKLKGMKGASKNTVKRPMPKLDSTRLTGERGIPILPRIFQDVKLKGKGHEVDDLRVVMRYLEHWAHRLFPKMPFDEVLERVERLGAKRDVQTCIKKMRLDMPVLGSDSVSRGGEEEEEEEVDKDQNQQSEQNPSAEELFDALMQEEQELEAEMTGSQAAGHGRGGEQGTDSSPHVRRHTDSDTAPSDRREAPSPPTHSTGSDAPLTTTGLSADVLEKIERNRRLAMEKRARKLGVPAARTPRHEKAPSLSPTDRGVSSGTPQPGQQSEGADEAAVVTGDGEHGAGVPVLGGDDDASVIGDGEQEAEASVTGDDKQTANVSVAGDGKCDDAASVAGLGEHVADASVTGDRPLDSSMSGPGDGEHVADASVTGDRPLDSSMSGPGDGEHVADASVTGDRPLDSSMSGPGDGEHVVDASVTGDRPQDSSMSGPGDGEHEASAPVVGDGEQGCNPSITDNPPQDGNSSVLGDDDAQDAMETSMEQGEETAEDSAPPV